MAIVFDGREFARKITEELKSKVAGNPRKLKLVTILDPEDRGSVVYTNLKAKKAVELGVEFVKIQNSGLTISEVENKIRVLNSDETVDGIMVQLPIEGGEEFVSLIESKKDVDGLKTDSIFVPATVRAVIKILEEAFKEVNTRDQKLKVCVVGANGEVGRGLMKYLPTFIPKLEVFGMGRKDFDGEKIKTADVVISCTGQVGLIQSEMVKSGVIAIDVGYPGGDMVSEVKEKASFFTPVPGGVGPVTVTMLFYNLLGE